MAACNCNRGWRCEEHPGQPWPHDHCAGSGELCTNPTCKYGKAALAQQPLDDAHDREHYPQLFDAHGRRQNKLP